MLGNGRGEWEEGSFPAGVEGGRLGNTQAAQKVIAIANSVDVFMAHSVNQTIAKPEGNSFARRNALEINLEKYFK